MSRLTFVLLFASATGYLTFGKRASIFQTFAKDAAPANQLDSRQEIDRTNRDSGREQPGPPIASETLLQTSAAWNGAPCEEYPSGKPELSVLRITIPPHHKLPWHTHPMPNIACILSGEITVEELDGKQRRFGAEQVVPETVNTVHRGITGDQAVTLIVFYAGAKGMPLAEQTP